MGKEDFESAVLRTVAGIEKKRSILSPAEKIIVSAHEVGHAVVGTAVGNLIPGTARPEQLSIVARSGGALGFTYTPPGEEDRKLMFADELRGRLVTLMGGRAAEIVACSRVSTGAFDDISQKVTVFAPTDAAFTTLQMSMGWTPGELLASPGLDSLLLYHVVEGLHDSGTLGDEQELPTLSGQTMTVVADHDEIIVNGEAYVVTSDIESTNGVIHVLDTVLSP